MWRIYPSSKWSSQWPYDGYIRHGWMTSCRCGRDSATPECFGRGSQGTIFVRSSKISLFVPELCSFRRVFFVSRAFVRFGAKRSSAGAFGFDDVLELFLETPLGHFCELRLRPRVFFEKFLFFFKAQPVLLAWQLWWSPGWTKHFGDDTSKIRMKTSLPGVGEIERRRTVVIGTSHLRWSMVQKRKKKKHKEVSVWLCEVSTLHHRQTSEFLRTCFQEQILLPFCTSLFSCTWMYSCRSVRLQRGDSEKKQSSVTFPVLITDA